MAYSHLVPLWEAPDEPSHYQRALSFARESAPPTLPRTYYGQQGQPAGYYAVAGGILGLLDRWSPDAVTPYFPPRRVQHYRPVFMWSADNYFFQLGPQLLRWANVAIGVLTLLLIARGAEHVGWRGPGLSAAVMALAGLNPQFLHVSASVTNDAMANLAGALLFWLMMRTASEPLRLQRAMIVVVCSALAPLLVKLTTLPMAGACLAVLVWRALEGGVRIRRSTAFLAIAVASLTILAGVWLGGSWVLASLWARLSFVHPDAATFWRTSVETIRHSYWGLFAWLSVGLPRGVVGLLESLMAVGAIGSLRLAVPSWRTLDLTDQPWAVLPVVGVVVAAAVLDSWYAVAVVIALGLLLHRAFRQDSRVACEDPAVWRAAWLACGLTLLAVAKNLVATPETQGRHLFPSIGSLSLVAVGGWMALLPGTAAKLLAPVVVVGMTALNVYALVAVVLPTYFQPWLDG